MRTATEYKLHNKTQRDKLKIRTKPYFVSLSPGLCLGYLARGGKATGRAGVWYSRRQVGERIYSETGSHSRYKLKQLGQADDLPQMVTDGVTILDYDEACAKAREHAAELARGPVRKALTVRDAIAKYLDFLEQHNSPDSRYQTECKFNKWVLTHPIADEKVNDLSLSQLQEWQAGMITREDDDLDQERRSQDTANRVIRSLKAALNRAYDHRAETGVMSKDAWGTSFRQFKDVGAQREYHFTVPEVLRLIDAAEPNFAFVLKAAFYTGARPGELRKLSVKDFKPATKQLNIAKGKTKARSTTLTNEAVQFFASLTRDKMPNAPLLTKGDGTAWEAGDQKIPMRAALVDAELFTAKQLDDMARHERPVLYSLRHTYVSRAIEQGIPMLIIAQNVGNSVAMIERHYAKIIERTRQEWIEKGAPSLYATA